MRPPVYTHMPMPMSSCGHILTHVPPTVCSQVFAALKWVTRHVRTQFVLKLDEDTWVDAAALATWLRHLQPAVDDKDDADRAANADDASLSFYGGALRLEGDATVERTGRWSVATSRYNRSTFPTYATGGGYVLSSSAAAAVVREMASGSSPLLENIEDASVGLAAAAAHLAPTPMDSFRQRVKEPSRGEDAFLREGGEVDAAIVSDSGTHRDSSRSGGDDSGRGGGGGLAASAFDGGELDDDLAFECCLRGTLLYHKPLEMEACELCAQIRHLPDVEARRELLRTHRRSDAVRRGLATNTSLSPSFSPSFAPAAPPLPPTPPTSPPLPPAPPAPPSAPPEYLGTCKASTDSEIRAPGTAPQLTLGHAATAAAAAALPLRLPSAYCRLLLTVFVRSLSMTQATLWALMALTSSARLDAGARHPSHSNHPTALPSARLAACAHQARAWIAPASAFRA